jgi:hypothetical protein
MKSIKINIKSKHPLPPRWAMWVAQLLPWSVKQCVNLMLVGSSAALAEKGLDATLREVLEAARGVKEDVDWERPIPQTWKRSDPENNDHEKGDF